MDQRTVKTCRTAHIERSDPVWVWDGAWFPATVAEVALAPGRERLTVRFESGVSAPASFAALKPRDPDALGADRPSGRGTTMVAPMGGYAPGKNGISG